MITACSTSESKDSPTTRKFTRSYSEAYSEPCQASKMERFAKQVNVFQPLTFFAKRSILNVWQGSEYASIIDKRACEVRLKTNKEINICYCFM